MAFATLDQETRLAGYLVEKATDDGDDADKEEARKKIMELKGTLQNLKDQVLQEAEKAKQDELAKKPSGSTKKISQWVKQIAKKIPTIKKLEKKLGMLEGLDPIMETIVNDLEKVTDFRNLLRLNKEQGINQGPPGFDNDDATISSLTKSLIKSKTQAALDSKLRKARAVAEEKAADKAQQKALIKHVTKTHKKAISKLSKAKAKAKAKAKEAEKKVQ